MLCQTGQDLDVVVAGDTDDLDPGLGQAPNALLKFPVSLEEIIFPLDHVSGKQHCLDSGADGNIYSALPGAGRAQFSCSIREFIRQPGRRSPQVYIADSKDLHEISPGTELILPPAAVTCVICG